MRCNICDAIIENPVWNDQLQTFDPCPDCLGEDVEEEEEEEKEHWEWVHN